MANDLTTASPFGGGFQRRPGGGVRNWLNYVNTEGWTDKDGVLVPPTRQFIAVSSAPMHGGWKTDPATGKKRLELHPAESWDKFDAEAASAEIPHKDWPINERSGQPEPPIQLFCRVELIDEHGTPYVYEKNTYGARKTAQELETAAANLQALYGADTFPIVTLGEIIRKMPPPVNQLKAPHFVIIGHRRRSGGPETDGGPAIEVTPPTPQLGGPAEPTPAAPAPASARAPAPAPAPAPKPKVQLDQFAGTDQPRDDDDALPY